MTPLDKSIDNIEKAIALVTDIDYHFVDTVLSYALELLVAKRVELYRVKNIKVTRLNG